MVKRRELIYAKAWELSHESSKTWKLFQEAARLLKEVGGVPIGVEYSNSYDGVYRETLIVTLETT